MTSTEVYMFRYFGQSTVTFSANNVERMTKITFAKNLTSCTCKTCRIV